MTRYWLYKNNRDGGPAGYWGDWDAHVFAPGKRQQWGGSYSTTSAEVLKRLDEDVLAGDVVVAYQTDDRAVVGFCVVARISGPAGDRKLWLEPIERLGTPLPIHDCKAGTPLESSNAVNGPVMLRELSAAEMHCLVDLASVPKRVLKGRPKAGGYTP